jgi:hypothetical protein
MASRAMQRKRLKKSRLPSSMRKMKKKAAGQPKMAMCAFMSWPQCSLLMV